MKQTFTHSSICFTLRRIWKFPTLLPGLFVLLLTFFTACGGDDDSVDDNTPTGEIVFSLDFGAAPASAAFADSFTSWQTQTGSGAGSVGYASYGVKIRSGYDGASAGASGKGYATMTATKATNYFTVKNISLPAGVQNFTLSFYAAFATGDVVLSVSDGSSTRALTYQASSSYDVWSKVSVGFTLTNPVSNLTITLAPSQAFNYEDRKFGLNFDDVVLTTGGGGQEIDLGSAGKEYRWAELPDTPADMTNRKIYTFWSTTSRRNSICATTPIAMIRNATARSGSPTRSMPATRRADGPARRRIPGLPIPT